MVKVRLALEGLVEGKLGPGDAAALLLDAPLEELLDADEVFLTTSSGGLVPVARVDERVFSNDAPGETSLRLREVYRDWTRRPEHRTEIDYG